MSAKAMLSDETWCPTCGQLWLDREKLEQHNAERKAKAARDAGRAKRKKVRRQQRAAAPPPPPPPETQSMAELKATLLASIKEAKKDRRSTS